MTINVVKLVQSQNDTYVNKMNIMIRAIDGKEKAEVEKGVQTDLLASSTEAPPKGLLEVTLWGPQHNQHISLMDKMIDRLSRRNEKEQGLADVEYLTMEDIEGFKDHFSLYPHVGELTAQSIMDAAKDAFSLKYAKNRDPQEIKVLNKDLEAKRARKKSKH